MPEIQQIPDKRAPSMPDVPYSAYCQVCWNPVYTGWIDGDHGGTCHSGHTKAEDCPDAGGRAKLAADIRRFKEQSGT